MVSSKPMAESVADARSAATFGNSAAARVAATPEPSGAAGPPAVGQGRASSRRWVPAIVRALVVTGGRAAAQRAAPLVMGILVASAVIFGGNGMNAADLTGLMARAPGVQSRIAGAQRCDIFRAQKEYTYRAKQVAGEYLKRFKNGPDATAAHAALGH